MTGKLLVMVSLALALVAGQLAAAEEESQLNAEYLWDQFVKLFNISLVILILFFLLRKPIKGFFRDRAEQIDESIAAAQEAREEAERRMREVELQVSRLEEEIAEIKVKAAEAGEAEKARIIASAERESERIVRGTEREIENRVKAAQQELKAYAADLAVEQASRLLSEKLGAEDDRRLIERSLGEIKGVGVQ